MTGFKLIAIRPLEGCEEKYTKVLQKGVIYRFYNEYTFFNSDGKEVGINEDVDSIKYNKLVTYDFFSKKNPIVNIASVVGKNGSGKSSLLELFYIGIYILAVKYKTLDISYEALSKMEKDLVDDKHKLMSEKENVLQNQNKVIDLYDELKLAIGQMTETEIKFSPSITKIQISLEELDRKLEKLDETDYVKLQEAVIVHLKKELDDLVNSIKIELFYQMNDLIYCLKVGKADTGEEFINFRLIKSNALTSDVAIGAKRDKVIAELLAKPVDLSNHFFYTIAVSYSHHGLNSLEEGSWLDHLFHKNDGYQTPIVVNPMRTEGNININREDDLVKQRLLSNLLEPVANDSLDNLRVLAPNKIATNLILKFNQEKFANYQKEHKLSKIENKGICTAELYKAYTGIDLVTYNEPTLEGTKFYLEDKLIRICSTYKRYQDFIKNDRFVNIPGLIDTVLNDRSHITFKIKQAMNFICFKLVPHLEPSKEVSVDIEQLSLNIQEKVSTKKRDGRLMSVMEFLPPPTFDIRIELKDKTFFDKFSSGEKQKVYCISSIIYHLININSVFNNANEAIYKYKNVNILFDEVEQYFHPDLQRNFINDVILQIERINPNLIEHIHGINVLFATHSPFILSDLPNTNILRLKKDSTNTFNEADKTFGANIHELLENDFFMEEGFMGEFAKSKILKLISEIKTKDSMTIAEHKEYSMLINLIGEDFIRAKLFDMLSDKTILAQ